MMIRVEQLPPPDTAAFVTGRGSMSSEAIRVANEELARRAAAFRTALLDSSNHRRYSTARERELADALAQAEQVGSAAREFVSKADAPMPERWASRVARPRGRGAPPRLLTGAKEQQPKLSQLQLLTMALSTMGPLRDRVSQSRILDSLGASQTP